MCIRDRVIADALGVKLNAVHISTEFLVAADGGRYDFNGSLLGDKANTVVFDISKLKRLSLIHILYRIGIQQAQFSLSSAIGLFNSLVNFIVLITINKMCRRIGDTSLW